jgi:hypothetical protein
MDLRDLALFLNCTGAFRFIPVCTSGWRENGDYLAIAPVRVACITELSFAMIDLRKPRVGQGTYGTPTIGHVYALGISTLAVE